MGILKISGGIEMFVSNHNQGFTMKFENGWMISVQFSPDHHCSASFDKRPDGKRKQPSGRWASDTAEVGIFRANGSWLKGFGDGGVKGHCNADEVSGLIAMTASLPNGIMADDGFMMEVI
jgi:hypothetical protein